MTVSLDKEYALLIKRTSENIVYRRKMLGLTQKDMEKFGFDVKNYQKIEYGVHHYSLFTVFRLSRIFGCSIEELIHDKTTKSSK